MSEGTLVIVVLAFFVAEQSINPLQGAVYVCFGAFRPSQSCSGPVQLSSESGSDYSQLARRLRSDSSSGRTLKVSNIDHNVSSRP
jgi:hypothetical protein